MALASQDNSRVALAYARIFKGSVVNTPRFTFIVPKIDALLRIVAGQLSQCVVVSGSSSHHGQVSVLESSSL